MKEIINLSLVVLLCLTVLPVASAYDFNYEKPDLDAMSYQAFLLYNLIEVPNQAINLIYNLLTSARFYEDKTILCEAELIDTQKKLYNCRDGGGSNTPVIQVTTVNDCSEEVEVELTADFNGDGQVDNNDYIIWKCNFPMSQGATHGQGDANGDGDVDAFDFGDWQSQYTGAPGDAFKFGDIQADC